METQFHSILCFWNRHGLAPWGQSDVYIVSHLTAVDENAPINMDTRELSDCKWICPLELARTEKHALILKILEQSFGITKEHAETKDDDWRPKLNPSASVKRFDVQWPGRPKYPTYIAKKH